MTSAAINEEAHMSYRGKAFLMAIAVGVVFWTAVIWSLFFI
jgi:hypothetical protein